MKCPRNILLALTALFFSVSVIAQPSIQWKKAFGGTDTDEGKIIRQTSDGGFIMVGSAGSTNGDVVGGHGFFDVWVLKLDPSGVIEWKTTLGGSMSDMGHTVRQTADGGYVIASSSKSSNGDVSGAHGNNDCWIVKLSTSGAIVWQKALGGPGHDFAYSIEQTFDGGYIVAGTNDDIGGDVSVNHGADDYWLIKLSSTGSIQWEKSFGGSDEDIATSVVQTTDTGYIVAGTTESTDGDITLNHGNRDVWVIKVSKTGAMEWQKTYGGSLNDACGTVLSPGAIRQTSDGYIFAGWTSSSDGDVTSNHGDYDFWVVKLSPTGNISWQKTFGGSDDDEANSIELTSDGGYIVAGVAQSNNGDVAGNHGGYDFWLVKITATGSIQWQKAMGGNALGLGDCAFSAQQTSDMGYIVGGYCEGTGGDIAGGHGSYDFWAVKLLCVGGNLGASEVCKGGTTTLSNTFVGGSWFSTSPNITISSGGVVTGVSAGTAVVTYVVNTVCGLAMPMTYVTVNALPTPVIIGGGLTMTTSIPYATYQWLSASGPIAGANDTTYTAPSYGGTYRVYVTDSNGCSDTSAVFTLLNNAVANSNANGVEVYPNPANTAIYISGAAHNNVKVFSTLGRLVKEGADCTFIDVADLAPGCYLVQVWNDKRECIYRGTVMKQ